MFTVKKLASIAGVTPRTLRHYDQIGLLRPHHVGENGYRYYNEAALLRLQQILLYRALDVPLREIEKLLGADDFDVLAALESHHAALTGRLKQVQALLDTVDKTILHVKGRHTMQAHQLFDGLKDRQQQDQFFAEAESLYGSDQVTRSQRLWESYGADQREAILAEGNAIYAGLVAAIPGGPHSATVQELIGQWRRHLEFFWTPELAQLNGLAETYRDDPRFRANFDKLDPQLAELMVAAVAHYVALRA